MCWGKTTSLDRSNFGREDWFQNPDWSKLRATHEGGRRKEEWRGRCLGRRGRLCASPLVTICVSWAVLLRFSLEEKLFLVHKTLPGNCTWFLLSDHYIFIVAVYNSDFCNQPVTISTFERKVQKACNQQETNATPFPNWVSPSEQNSYRTQRLVAIKCCYQIAETDSKFTFFQASTSGPLLQSSSAPYLLSIMFSNSSRVAQLFAFFSNSHRHLSLLNKLCHQVQHLGRDLERQQHNQNYISWLLSTSRVTTGDVSSVYLSPSCPFRFVEFQNQILNFCLIIPAQRSPAFSSSFPVLPLSRSRWDLRDWKKNKV